MTLFPLGTLIQLVQLARRGSRGGLLALVAFLAGAGLLIVSVLAGSTAGLIAGVVLFALGSAGSRPTPGGGPRVGGSGRSAA